MTDQPADDKPRSLPLIPLGALAAGFGLINLAAAQTSPPAPATTDPPRAETVMPVIKASGSADRQGKDGVQATTSRIGKGEQELRDIPQSLTVVTEKQVDAKTRSKTSVNELLRGLAD